MVYWGAMRVAIETLGTGGDVQPLSTALARERGVEAAMEFLERLSVARR